MTTLSDDTAPGLLKTYLEITRAWGLTATEASTLLGIEGGISVRKLNLDQIERIRHTVDIYRLLHALLLESADAWIRKPNQASLFGGRTALELLTTGTDGFRQVRNYLGANG